MRQILLGLLTCLLGFAAQAQQTDSLPPRTAAVATNRADSLKPVILPLRFSCTSEPVFIQTSTAGRLPPFTTIQPVLSRVAGVQVTPYSGAPGAWSTVRIRGVNNITGSSQPLYVVDGVPAYNTEVTPELWSGARDFYRNTLGAQLTLTPQTPTANPLLDLAVEDVATVEVIKGAAATARYGMQGSNGVIVISTRQGGGNGTAPQPLRVRYAGWGGVQQVRQRYQLLNARQYAEVVNQSAPNYGTAPPYSAAEIASLGETNWQDQVFRTAGMQSHNLSVDGLNKATRYLLAANYLQQNGVVVGSDLSRYQLRLNLDQQLSDKLRVGLRASASQTDQHYAGTDFDGSSLLQQALLAIPARPARTGTRRADAPVVLRELSQYHSTARTRRLLAQLNATYQFSPALGLTVRASRQLAVARQLEYSPEYFQSTNVLESGTDSTIVRNWVLAAELGYQRTFGEHHAVAAGLSYLRQQYESRQSQRQYNGLGGPGNATFYDVRLKGNPTHSPSAFGSYTYAGRYEVQASLRTDIAFSADGTRSEFHWLPGGQLSWHLHKEAFLANVPGLRQLTLWAGTGQTSTYFSPDRTTHHDAGLRLGLFDNLTITATAYQRRTQHAQAVIPVLVATPAGASYRSFYPDATLRNRGLELTISSSWRRGALLGTTDLAAATNRAEVAALDLPPGLGAPSNVLEAGQPLARFYVLEQLGTNPVGSAQPGAARFRDRDGNGQISYHDGTSTGSGLPRYTLNLSQHLQLRRWQLDAQLDGLFGYQLLNQTLVSLDQPTGLANSSAYALGYWTPTHQDTNVPAPGSYPSPYLSNLALANGNHLRLSQFTLGYDVLTAAARKINVWVGGQNIFVTGNYRGFDPNVSSGGAAPLLAGRDASVYPVARVWQLGVRGQF